MIYTADAVHGNDIQKCCGTLPRTRGGGSAQIVRQRNQQQEKTVDVLTPG